MPSEEKCQKFRNAPLIRKERMLPQLFSMQDWFLRKQYAGLTSCLESFYVQYIHSQTFLLYKPLVASTSTATFPDGCISISLSSLSAYAATCPRGYLQSALLSSSPLTLGYSSCNQKNWHLHLHLASYFHHGSSCCCAFPRHLWVWG